VKLLLQRVNSGGTFVERLIAGPGFPPVSKHGSRSYVRLRTAAWKREGAAKAEILSHVSARRLAEERVQSCLM